MKIGFDAKRAFHNTSGLGNYSRYVISSLLKYYPEQEYHLFTPSQKINFMAHDSLVKIHEPVSFTDKLFPSYWRRYSIAAQAAKAKVELYHGLSNELPEGLHKKKIKSVVTIHDLIFLRYPEYYKPIDRWIYKKKFKEAADRADAVIAISEQTKNDLIEFFKIPEKRITIIYQDCNSLYHERATGEEVRLAKNKFHLPERYILSVGTLEPRKNQLRLLEAFKNIKDQEIKLVLVGRVTEYKNELLKAIEKYSLQKRVVFVEHVSTQELRALYQLAQMLVYPSVFEGFGIPILEGLNSNIPVITSKGSCFSEVGGDAALYADPNSSEEMTAMMEKVLTDATLRNKMIAEGAKQSLLFRDSISALKTMELYHHITGLRE